MEIEENQDELNVQNINFSQFIRTLYGAIINDYDDVHFMIELVNNSLKDGAEPVFSERNKKGNSNLKNYKRFLLEKTNTSRRGLPKKTAIEILDSFKKEKFCAYVEEMLEEEENADAAQSLKDELFNSNEDVNCINIVEYCASLFQQILQRIKTQKRHRTSKKQIEKTRTQSTENISNKDYESKIKSLLDSIFAADSNKNVKKLRMVPVDVQKKIDGNPILEEKVTSWAIKYYRYIKEILFTKQEENPCNFDYLASQIIEIYNGYKESEENQEKIFDLITEYFMHISHRKIGRSTCEVLVSFFIQDCEVFDVITK